MRPAPHDPPADEAPRFGFLEVTVLVLSHEKLDRLEARLLKKQKDE